MSDATTPASGRAPKKSIKNKKSTNAPTVRKGKAVAQPDTVKKATVKKVTTKKAAAKRAPLKRPLPSADTIPNGASPGVSQEIPAVRSAGSDAIDPATHMVERLWGSIKARARRPVSADASASTSGKHTAEKTTATDAPAQSKSAGSKSTGASDEAYSVPPSERVGVALRRLLAGDVKAWDDLAAEMEALLAQWADKAGSASSGPAQAARAAWSESRARLRDALGALHSGGSSAPWSGLGDKLRRARAGVKVAKDMLEDLRQAIREETDRILSDEKSARALVDLLDVVIPVLLAIDALLLVALGRSFLRRR